MEIEIHTSKTDQFERVLDRMHVIYEKEPITRHSYKYTFYTDDKTLSNIGKSFNIK